MKLIVAEDEKELAKALKRILEHSNYTVDTVYNGEDALYYIENGNYDAAILDIMMPKMDGIEVLKRIRKDGIKIPVIMLTAKSEVDDKVEGLDSGANDYLTKPFQTKELLARIRAMTRNLSENAVSSVLEFGNIKLDTASYEMYSENEKIRLANKEFQMMEMLMNSRKQPIPTEVFMEKIWGYDSDTDISVVWVYISYLRKKLQTLKADINIKASRNQGYMLEEMGKNK
ncbi:response regulator transcription factor [Peptacetobacter hominis]|uniref:Stage 0 sporulation protein A homolog n=1 Tax=Peptacetobacter hominis TaxID=2743610 RepID=A0A544QW85_9FIRM|nr:response regulator transcription factor [Peptacetobacter hominis]TQQ84960.1 response regulator transcription factor [Peptacetobacter hominis]